MYLMIPQNQEPNQELLNNLILISTKTNHHKYRFKSGVTRNKVCQSSSIKFCQTAASDEDDDAANEVFFSKLVDLLPKFDKSHIVALVKYHAMASKCRKDQGRVAQNILKSIDSSMKSMVCILITIQLNHKMIDKGCKGHLL